MVLAIEWTQLPFVFHFIAHGAEFFHDFFPCDRFCVTILIIDGI